MSARTGQLAVRMAGVTVLSALVQTGAVAALARLLEVQLAVVNAGLLLFATALLGAVWALRAELRGQARGGSSLAAATTPLVACALFLAPRLWLGPLEPTLLILGVASLAAAPVEGIWSRWLLPTDGSTGSSAKGSKPDDRAPARRGASTTDGTLAIRAALGSAAPPAGVAMIAGISVDGSSRLSLLAGTFASIGLLAVWAARRTRRTLEEAHGYAEFLRRIDVRPDAVLRPDPPALHERWLREIDRELCVRADDLAREAESDAHARNQIADARALRTRFMAAMGHELRSPLNSIVGFAQVLERGLDGELSKGQRESVTMVRRSAEELIMLLTDVLDLARLEAGKLKLRPEWTPSVEILTEAVARGQSLVKGKDVKIEAELQPGLPPVHVDSRRIVQAVVALFRHAASSLHRTTIRLRARVAHGPPGPKRQLRVEILDAIGAIPEAEVERIFEAFQEITVPSGRRVGGLGMALSLSRGLVRLHGGEVWAESFPGAGTVLSVAIPLELSE